MEIERSAKVIISFDVSGAIAITFDDRVHLIGDDKCRKDFGRDITKMREQYSKHKIDYFQFGYHHKMQDIALFRGQVHANCDSPFGHYLASCNITQIQQIMRNCVLTKQYIYKFYSGNNETYHERLDVPHGTKEIKNYHFRDYILNKNGNLQLLRNNTEPFHHDDELDNLISYVTYQITMDTNGIKPFPHKVLSFDIHEHIMIVASDQGVFKAHSTTRNTMHEIPYFDFDNIELIHKDTVKNVSCGRDYCILLKSDGTLLDIV